MVYVTPNPRGRMLVIALVAALASAMSWSVMDDGFVALAPVQQAPMTMGSDPSAGLAVASCMDTTTTDPSPTASVLPDRSDRVPIGASLVGHTRCRDGSVLPDIAVIASDGTATRSGIDGRFMLSGLCPGSHTLHAEATGLVSIPSGVILVRGGETIDGVDLVLDRACFVTGRVTTDQFQPLAGANVSGRLRDASALPTVAPGSLGQAARIVTSTDAEGRFRLGPFAPGRVELTAEHEACIPFARVYASDATELQIKLPAASSIAGVVLDPDGQPAAIHRALLLVANPNRAGWHVVTEVTPPPADAAAGRFHLRVPLAKEVRVVAVTRDFALASSEPMRVLPGKVSPLELHATVGARVTGRVRDGSGTAIAGAEVLLREDGATYELAQLRTGTDGGFTVALAPGRYTACFRKPGYAPRRVPVEIAAGSPAPVIDCQLVRGAALTGRIVSAAGAVLAALEVHAVRVDDAQVHPEIALVCDGAFAFDFLAPGDYRIGMRERGDASTVREGTPVRVVMGDRRQLDLTPGVLGLCRLHGEVQDNGAALPFASVHLARGPARKVASTMADRFGRFEFDGLQAGPLTLTVTHGASGPVLASRALNLAAGEDRAEVIAVTFGSLSGRVVAARDRMPMHDIRIDVIADDGHVLATTRSGQDGRFSLPVVQAGDFTLGLGHVGKGIRKQQKVQVIAGQATPVPEVEF